MAIKRGKEIPTIDVVLITVKPYQEGEGEVTEIALDTANKIEVAPQTDTQDAVKLVVKGRLIAQKMENVTITGHTITLTDNVFGPELAVILQGGTITYDSVDQTKLTGYKPPVVGSNDKGSIFELNAYSAIYDASGSITGYEKCMYPNCKGQPFANNSEDGVFRVSTYTIISAPKKGEAPYDIKYVDTLPVIA